MAVESFVVKGGTYHTELWRVLRRRVGGTYHTLLWSFEVKGSEWYLSYMVVESFEVKGGEEPTLYHKRLWRVLM